MNAIRWEAERLMSATEQADVISMCRKVCSFILGSVLDEGQCSSASCLRCLQGSLSQYSDGLAAI